MTYFLADQHSLCVCMYVRVHMYVMFGLSVRLYWASMKRVSYVNLVLFPKLPTVSSFGLGLAQGSRHYGQVAKNMNNLRLGT